MRFRLLRCPLCGVQITEIVSSVNDPELLITSSGIQNLLIGRKHDECGEAYLCANLNNVRLRILNRASTWLGIGARRKDDCQDTDDKAHQNHM